MPSFVMSEKAEEYGTPLTTTSSGGYKDVMINNLHLMQVNPPFTS